MILKQVDDRLGVPDLRYKSGMFQQTTYQECKKCDSLMPLQVKRLKQLDKKNRRLKEIVAEHLQGPKNVCVMHFL